MKRKGPPQKRLRQLSKNDTHLEVYRVICDQDPPKKSSQLLLKKGDQYIIPQ
ncbi:hypothetical protein DPMN_142888 [Dreissena polymorpha]|uniref:Uncharacterized protein n=1 Tax=Dreissena polymorpha TaxID=45954 RepID=A0A9D4GCK1_DREPO|nr:hypothetical protein DPMN_142888 [Dreissena polymorpha]